MLKDKNVVFIGVKSFNIQGVIVSGLLELGAEVRFFDERPDNSIVGKPTHAREYSGGCNAFGASKCHY